MLIIICLTIRVKKYHAGHHEDWVVVELMGGVRLPGKATPEGAHPHSHQDHSGQPKHLYHQDQNREKGQAALLFSSIRVFHFLILKNLHIKQINLINKHINNDRILVLSGKERYLKKSTQFFL